MGNLDIIIKPITAELATFREQFDARLTHSNPLLNQVLHMVRERKGKMMRPILALLSAKLFDEVNERSFHTAAAFEFFHTASLLHDDVVDESDLRRGNKSINSAFDNKVAVLVGDYILALALEEASLSSSTRLINIISHAAQNLADGELLQLHNVSSYNLSEDVYFDIIRNKTAALFSGCAEAGAMTTTTSESDISNLRIFGELIGLCFQIRDDIFDYTNDSSIGKPTGNDMKEGKLTLPVLFVLNTCKNDSMVNLAHKVKDGLASPEEISQLISFTHQNGGIDYALRKMLSLADKAKSLLNIYPDSDVKQALLDYADFVVGRTI